MTVVVPDPLPLQMPPGNAEALGALVSDVAGAAFHLSVLAGALAGPAASAPGWLGDDGTAAATQVGVVAAVARDAAAAVLAAMHRLSDHAEYVHAARRQVAALEQEQREDFAAAWTRLSRIEDARLAVMTLAPEWVGTVEDLRASEASRRRRHAALLDDVADDAAATARVLADSCAAVGGRGAPGDAGRVLAYLATKLPEWGDAELSARGRALAGALISGPFGSEKMEAAARRAVPYAQAPAFAASLLTGLGVEGVGLLLGALGDDRPPASSDIARVLAAALGAAIPGPSGDDPVALVLAAGYVHTGDHGGPSDAVAAGMAAVLVAAVPGRRGGVRLETVAEWGRQLLRRERAQGVFAGAGAVPSHGDPVMADPARLVVDILAASDAAGPAAALLADRGAWDTLLARRWGDGGAALAEVVTLAGSERTAAGAVAVRVGLEALAAGLTHSGDPEHWTVNRETAAVVAEPLASGLRSHIEVVTGVLTEEATSCRPLDGRDGDALRGLGYLTVDRSAAVVIERALVDWAVEQPYPLDGASRTEPAPAVALPAAYLAVQEYGQRLAYALRAFEVQDAAEDRRFLWTMTFNLLTLPGRLGTAVGVVEPFAARLLGTDGSWDIGPDRGLVFDREDAAQAAIARALEGDADAALATIARQSRAAFDRVAGALGPLRAPEEPETHWWDPVLEALGSFGSDSAKDAAKAGRGNP